MACNGTLDTAFYLLTGGYMFRQRCQATVQREDGSVVEAKLDC